MALLNFSVPYAPTASPAGPFLAAAAASASLGGLNAAAAVNSLIYGANRQHQPPNPPPYAHGTVPPPAPNRRTATASRRLPPNEPYHQQQQQQQQQQAQQRSPRYYKEENLGGRITNTQASAKNSKEGHYPSRPSGYTRIDTNSNESNQPGSKTSLHAILDYDDDFDDYNYDDEEEEVIAELGHLPPVTPIQGPIYVKNGSVPVVPLYSYPVLNNGTFVQIPILWTALSLALGLEIRGEIIRGVPCIKRFHQLFCPTAGNSYPIDQIERFIDENKALMKRMYGEFQMSEDFGSPPGAQQGKRNSKRDTAADGGETTTASSTNKKKMPPGVPDIHGAPDPIVDSETTKGESYFSKLRSSRQSFRNNQSSESGRVDACESKVEIVTPYWASNSAGKVRAIVNTQHFEQAIHQEVCSSKTQTKRCSGECGCEQKYKWHRLLAYDPDNDCKGIFMDWFLFPSCCVCRCAPTFGDK